MQSPLGYTAFFSTVYCTLYTEQCTLYTLSCKIYTLNCTLYTVHCTLYSTHNTLFPAHNTLKTKHCTVYTVQCTVQCTVYAVHCTLYTVHDTGAEYSIGNNTLRKATTGWLVERYGLQSSLFQLPTKQEYTIYVTIYIYIYICDYCQLSFSKIILLLQEQGWKGGGADTLMEYYWRLCYCLQHILGFILYKTQDSLSVLMSFWRHTPGF